MKLFQNLKFQDIFLVVHFLLFVVLLGLRDFTGMTFSQISVLGYILSYLFFADFKHIVYYSALVIPMLCGLFLFAILFLFIGMVIKSPTKLNQQQIVFSSILCTIELIDYAFFADGNAEIKKSLMYCSFVVTIFYLIFLDNTVIDKKLFVRLYCYSTVLVLIFIFVSTILQWGFLHILTGYRIGDVGGYSDLNTKSETQAMFTLNANSLGYYALYVFSTLLIGVKKLDFNRYIYMLLMLLTIFIGFLSFSRTFLLLSALLFIISILSDYSFKKIFLSVVISLFAVIYLSSMLSDISSGFINRFNNGEFKSAGGRTELFESYNEYFLDNPQYWLTGTGVAYYKDICKQSNSMHNGTQQIYINTGFIGVLTFIAMFIAFKRKYNIHRLSKPYYLPLIGVSIFLQTLQFLNPTELMCPIILVAMVLRIGAEDKHRLKYKTYENINIC